MQLILDGRNSNSAQIAANYLQQVVKDYQQELMAGKPKPNNSETWWCATGTTRTWTINGLWCRH